MLASQRMSSTESNKTRQNPNVAGVSILLGLMNLYLVLLFSNEYAKILVIIASLVAFLLSAFYFYKYYKRNTFPADTET